MAQPETTQKQFRKLNTLEGAIHSAESAAEDAHWQQASIVVEMLNGGMTQRAVAAQWLKVDGKPYSAKHVNYVAQVWRRFHKETERPRWTDAMATIWAGSDDIKTTTEVQREFHEARAPKSEATAEKLVENILKGSPGVVDTVYQGLREGREERYHTPQERERRRQEADAYTDQIGRPVRDTFSKLAVILHLEQARDELRDMGSITGAAHEEILALTEEIRQEAEIKRAMAEVQ